MLALELTWLSNKGLISYDYVIITTIAGHHINKFGALHLDSTLCLALILYRYEAVLPAFGTRKCTSSAQPPRDVYILYFMNPSDDLPSEELRVYGCSVALVIVVIF